MKLLTARAAGVLADTINDANSTRKVYLLAAGLAVLGLALIAITVWFWRSTRHDPELLGPLEVLGDRKFRKLDGGEQRQALEESRPNDVRPLQWGVERGAAADDPALTASAFDAALVVADEPAAEASVAAPDAEAADDLHSDLDSILAAAGAVVPGRPARADNASTNGAPAKPADSAPAAADSAPAAPAGPAAADAETNPKPPTTTADDKAAAVPDAAPELVAGPAAAPAPKPDAEPAVMPLLIVPVDHDLRPSVSQTVDPDVAREPAAEPAEGVSTTDDAQDEPDGAADVEAEAERDEQLSGRGEHGEEDTDADVDATASIDPLLRMFNRNDT